MTRTAAELDVYEAAFLAGGPDRVVDTALVALVRTDRVRVHSPGELATTELTRRHPVEAAVLDAIGPAGHRSVDTIRWRLEDDARISDVGRRLRDDGLLARSLLRRGDQRGSPTADGRRVLAQLRTDRAAGSDEWRVALDGREALPDRARCTSIFGVPRTTAAPPSARSVRRQRRAALAADPGAAAAHTHLAAYGGGAALGFGDGGGFGEAGGGDGGGA
jgi:hypothetical protein